MAKRKTYRASFKAKVALEAIKAEQTVAELAAKYRIHPALVSRWRKQAVEGMAENFCYQGKGQSPREVVEDALSRPHFALEQRTPNEAYFRGPKEAA